MTKNNVQRIKKLKKEEEKLIEEPGFSQGDADRQTEINEKIKQLEKEEGINASNIESESQQVIQGETDTGGDVEVRTDTISNPDGGEPLNIAVTGTKDTNPDKSSVEKVQEAAENQGATEFARDVQSFQERTDQATVRPTQQEGGITLSGTRQVQREVKNRDQKKTGQRRKFQSTTGEQLPRKRSAQEVQKELRQEIIDNRPPQSTPSERFANTVEEAGFNLVVETQEEKDVISKTSKDFGLTNIGNDLGALFETGKGAVKTVQETQDLDFKQPLKDLEETGSTVKEEIVDPSLVAFTDLDESGIVQPSEEIKKRTADIQATSGTTPQDTVGFLGAASGGLFTTSAEQGSRFVTRSGRMLTGDKDLGRDIEVGEGIERIPVGTSVIAKELGQNPGKVVQEEAVQELTETAIGVGVPTLTITPTATSLKPKFKQTVKDAGLKAKQTGTSLKESVTDPNALGSGVGAFLPPEKQTTTGPATQPTPETKTTTETVKVDSQKLTGSPEQIITPDTTQTQTTTIESAPTAGTITQTAAQQKSVTEPQTIAESRPQTVSETVTDTQTLSASPSQTQTITLSQTPTQSLTDTVTETPTQTPTQSITATPTPTETPNDDDVFGQTQDSFTQVEDSSDNEFLPSVDAILTGTTEKDIDEDQVFTGFETRPLQEL